MPWKEWSVATTLFVPPEPRDRLRCYASGEAARLSIERDGFESRTARHFRSVAQPGSALRSERRGRWSKSSHSDHSLRAMTRISRAFSARRQHWRAARSYKPGQRTAVERRRLSIPYLPVGHTV
jgi:hypothetical protein